MRHKITATAACAAAALAVAGCSSGSSSSGGGASPQSEAGIKFYADLYLTGHLSPAKYVGQTELGNPGATSGGSNEDFALGKPDMYIDGPWAPAEFPANATDKANWASFPIPSENGPTPAPAFAGGSDLAIWAGSKRKTADWDLIQDLLPHRAAAAARGAARRGGEGLTAPFTGRLRTFPLAQTSRPAGDTALERLADAMLIPPFPGTTAPRWLLDALSRGLAGVTLFAANMAAGPDALAALTRTLRATVPDLLVAADEEGGDVTRVWYHTGSPYPGNAALGAVDDVALTEQVHAAIGADLATLGINLDLAPCLDVLAAPENPVIGTRSFGASPGLVARHGAAAVRGLQGAGVAACAKHFPGHGATLLDSHAEIAVVPDGLAAVTERDLPPFRAAVAAGVLAVMPGHLRVAGLTGELPASLSAAAIALLRSSLGFDGVIITDALEMRAVSDPFGIPGAAVRAAAAGNDLLCLGRDVPEDGYLAVRAALVAAVRSGELPGARLEEAAARVAALRARLAGAGNSGAGGRGGAAGTAGIGLRAARRALRLTGSLPELRDPVVVEVEPLVNMAAGDARWGLHAWVPSGSHRRVSAVPDPGIAAAGALKAAAGRSLVLVVRDVHRSPATRALVTSVLAERPDTVLVEMGLPYWQPQEGACQAYLATYGASRANAQAAAALLGLAPSPGY